MTHNHFKSIYFKGYMMGVLGKDFENLYNLVHFVYEVATNLKKEMQMGIFLKT